MKNKKNILLVIVAVLFALAVTVLAGVNYIVDFLWFREMGYTEVFFTKLMSQLKLGIPAFVVCMALIWVYLQGLKRSYYKKVEVVDKSKVSEKALNGIALALSAIFSLLTTLTVISRLWFQILQFTNSTDFNITDPIFNQDIGFYIFKLEFLQELNGLAMNIVSTFIVVTVIFYLILMALRRPEVFEEIPKTEEEQQSGFGKFADQFGKFAQGTPFEETFDQMNQKRQTKKQFDSDNMKQLLSIASNQITALGVLFFLMVGVNFFIRQYDILYSGTGIAYGAGFTDITVTLNLYRALMVLSVAAAIGFALGIRKRKIRYAVVVPVLMVVLSIGGSAVAGAVQGLIVAPDEINKESKYLENNIKYTQMAYDLQDIQIKDFPAVNTLTKDDILNNMGTLSNIRINDFEPAERFYNQTQSIRSYYTFNDVDVDRYMVNGEYTQTFLSAREIDEAKMINDQWLNKHLKYTHGYGITLSRVDKVTASGQPDMLIESIPPVSEVEEITIDRPEIYFGELTHNYVIVNTDEQEFDYPSGENNVYTEYEGDAGIHLNLLNRVLFAIREGNLELLVSTNIDSDSRIIINRNIVDRVSKIAPFLSYDADPYIVTVDGKLYWIMDAYTHSSYYPYSEPYSAETYDNYIRNSVKVVVDAYNGDVNFYVTDEEDPIIQTLVKIYPSLFQKFDDMPDGLKEHTRYPNALFNIQANVYKKYHMNDVKVFYQSEDLWAIANEIYGTEMTTISPSYFVMKLPGEEHVEFINSVPYTPNGKDNMTGLLVARNDGDHYGEMILYRLPKDRIIYGPSQIEAQVNQNTTISSEFTLWSNSGSSYSRGNMFVIPIEDSLMYVEPVYLEAANGSLPEVKRVIVVYGDKIAYESNLADALDSLFGDGAGDPLKTDRPAAEGSEMSGGEGGDVVVVPDDIGGFTLEELAAKANQAYEDAINAQQRGDWASYGEYLDQLSKYLNQMVTDEAEAEI